MKKLLVFLLLLTSVKVYSQINLDYYLPKDVEYDTNIPTPKSFLGYEVGEQHATPYEIMAYCRKVASLSNRIKIESYARTYENRELMLATVSSPQNLAKIDEIKKEHAKLAEPGLSSKLNTQAMHGVIWMGYSVHGNEASGTNSALLSIYYLAAAKGAKIDSLLSENIILIDPCINPDGGTRFSTWVNQNKSQTLVSDANAREFKETWPGGRTNHYWFDMNRDWLYQQLPESKGRLQKYYEWLPNILTDHHEMGSNSTFFFQPGMPSRTHPLTPAKNFQLTSKIGNYHAEGLDKIGSLYYTKENFDDFYYGKGSTLPDVNGGIGILFEQASSRGHLQETQNGLLSFPFTVRNQFSATLSTLKAGKNMRKELLDYMADFYNEKTIDDNKGYVFGGGSDNIATWEMVNMLLRNKIEIYKTSKTETLNGKIFDKNSFVVPSNQVRHRLVKSFFEKRTTFQDSAFYDISAWTLPLVMNVPYAEIKVLPALGEKIINNPFPEASVEGQSDYAYAFEWNGYYAARTAQKFLNAGYKLKYATMPFESQISGKNKKFSYGTILIHNEGKNPMKLMEECAKADGTGFFALKTGLTTSGINLGSEKFKPLVLPVPLMLVGDGVDAADAGETWHLMDQRFQMPLSFVDANQFNRLDLAKYTHLIINNGRYTDILSEEKIKAFLAKGGTIVALGEGATWLSSKKISTVNFKAETNNNGKSKRAFDEKNTYDGAMETSGAIFETQIDISHPLCYGYTNASLPIFKVNNIVFEDTGNPYNTPLMFKEKPLMAGYVHPKNMERFKSSPAVIAMNSGAGKIISISDNPNFRAFWYGTNRLFINALFFSSAIGAGRFEDED